MCKTYLMPSCCLRNVSWNKFTNRENLSLKFSINVQKKSVWFSIENSSVFKITKFTNMKRTGMLLADKKSIYSNPLL